METKKRTVVRMLTYRLTAWLFTILWTYMFTGNIGNAFGSLVFYWIPGEIKYLYFSMLESFFHYFNTFTRDLILSKIQLHQGRIPLETLTYVADSGISNKVSCKAQYGQITIYL